MESKKLWKIIGVIFAGCFAGGLAMIAIIIGHSLSASSFFMGLFGNFCSTMHTLPNSDMAFSYCNTGFVILTTTLTILGFFGIYKTAKEVGNIFKGFALYLLGWAIGYGLIRYLVK